jgi:hypothetical protein
MTTEELTARNLERRLTEMLVLLAALRSRLGRLGLTRDDPVYWDVERAYDALHDLYVVCKDRPDTLLPE